jgi:hypothetical protein
MFSIKNSTYPDLGMNVGWSGEKMVTNCLSDDMALVVSKTKTDCTGKGQQKFTQPNSRPRRVAA